jgi:hypothetical protein
VNGTATHIFGEGLAAVFLDVRMHTNGSIVRETNSSTGIKFTPRHKFRRAQ